MSRDIAIGVPSAGTKIRSGSTIGTDTYTEFAPARTTRTGFTIQNRSANTITVRTGGPGGPEYDILSFGSWSRTKQTGRVSPHAIYIKSAAGGDAFTFEEN